MRLTITRVCREKPTVGHGQSNSGVPEKDRGNCGEFTQERGPALIKTEEA
jgi:hypothetical protein